MLLHKEFDSIVICTKCHSLQKQSDMPSIAAGTFHITSDKIMEKFLQNFQIYSFVIVNVNLEKRNCYTLCYSPPTVVVHSETLFYAWNPEWNPEWNPTCMEPGMKFCLKSCLEP